MQATIYALQDKEDDALIGVKSTALLFGARRLLAQVVDLTGKQAISATSAAEARNSRGKPDKSDRSFPESPVPDPASLSDSAESPNVALTEFSG